MDDHIQAAIFSPSWKGAKEGVSLICVLLCGKLDGKLNPLKIEEDLPYSFDQTPPSNSSCPRIVAAQSGVPSEINAALEQQPHLKQQPPSSSSHTKMYSEKKQLWHLIKAIRHVAVPFLAGLRMQKGVLTIFSEHSEIILKHFFFTFSGRVQLNNPSFTNKVHFVIKFAIQQKADETFPFFGIFL